MAADHEHNHHVDLESSPSTGARGTAAAMGAVYGLGRHQVTVTDGETNTATTRIRAQHLKEYIGVSS